MHHFIYTLSSLFFILISLNGVSGQDTLKVMQYNLLFYGDCIGADLDDKDVWLDNITGFYKPDIFAVNEMSDRIAYANRIKSRSLTYGNMEFTEFTNNAGSNIVNMLFYNTDKIGYKGIQAIGTNSLRDINVYSLYLKNSIQGTDTTLLDCIVAHFKAGSGTSDQNQRMGAANDIMNWIDAKGSDYKNYLVMGDFNIGNANESAWKELVFNSNTSINLVDPTGTKNGWGPSTPEVMTQSTRQNSSDCGVGGGFDDRFDFILSSNGIDQGEDGLQYVAGSYAAFANNGSVPFNGSFNCSGNPSIPSTVCGSLVQMSDHLPVVMEIASLNTTPVDPAFKPVSISGLNNPFTNSLELNVRLHTPSRDLRISLLSPTGQVVYTHTISTPTLNPKLRISTESLPAGFYFLHLLPETGKGVTAKVIKN